MLRRSQLSFAPVLAVALLLLLEHGWTLRMVEIQIPRKLDEQNERPDPTFYPPKITLHADRSIDVSEQVAIGRAAGAIEWREDRWHADAPQVAATVADVARASYRDDLQTVTYLQADDGVLWGDFVDVVSSVRHITGGEVAVVSVEE